MFPELDNFGLSEYIRLGLNVEVEVGQGADKTSPSLNHWSFPL